tara:strand:+ start:1438 stop:1788 length:351 start_codon:yes stop_codon:yes gene_type:complete
MSKPIKTIKELKAIKITKRSGLSKKDMNDRIKNLNNYIGKTQMVMYYKWLLQEGRISENGAAAKRMKELQVTSKRENILSSKHINVATKEILLKNLDKEGVGDAKTSGWRNKVRQT